MRHLTFYSLVTSCLLLSPLASAAKQEKPAFDIKTLENLGYTADIAEFFSKEARFLPGINTVKIQINAAYTYTADARFDEQGQLCIDDALLSSLKLKPLKLASSCESLATLWPSAHVKAYPGQFRLELMLPEDAFDPEEDGLQHGGYAMLLNYNLFGQQIAGNNNDFRFFQGMLEPGLNISNWVIRNRSSLSSGLNTSAYTLDETSAIRAISRLKSILQLGQFGNNSDSFSGLPIVGAQLYSDSAQYRTSQLIVPIEGIANTNATVEISQRGRVIYRTVVAPGLFSLSSISNFSNGVPAEVEIIEEDGQRHRFAVSNALDVNAYQEASRYQIGLGAYRNPNASTESATDSPLVATGEFAFSPEIEGLQRATLGGLFSTDYQNATLKGNYITSKSSSLSGGISYGRGQEGFQGTQVDMQGTAQFNGNFSGSLSTLYRTEKYLSADEALSGEIYHQNSDATPLRNATSAAVTWAHPRWGAFSYVASHNQYYHTGDSGIAHTFSTSQHWKNMNLSLSLQTSALGQTAYASLSLPLGQGTLNNRVQQNSGALSLGSTYQNRLGDNGRYSVGVTQSDKQQRVNGSASLRTAYAQLATSVSQSSNQSHSASLSASGAVAYANNTLATSSQPIGDTFAIVNIPDQANLRVLSPGSGSVLTNRSGNAILPSLQPYSTVTAQVDTKTLPLNLRLDSTSADFSLERGSVATKRFSVTEVRQLLLTIRRADGSPIPVGATVLGSDGKFMGTVVGEGNVMLVNDDIGQALRIKVMNQSECLVDYKAPTKFDSNALYEMADAVCR